MTEIHGEHCLLKMKLRGVASQMVPKWRLERTVEVDEDYVKHIIAVIADIADIVGWYFGCYHRNANYYVTNHFREGELSLAILIEKREFEESGFRYEHVLSALKKN